MKLFLLIGFAIFALALSLHPQFSTRIGSRAVGRLFMTKTNKAFRPQSESGIQSNLIETQSNSQSRGPSRRKMGPPQRKLSQSQIEKDLTTGRVSVYCVGAEIDLVALRAHVFRRGFGSANHKSDSERPELVLTRGQGSNMETDEDEVLHVTNAPLYVSTLDSMKVDGSGNVLRSESGLVKIDSNGATKNEIIAAAAAADLVETERILSDDSAIEAEMLLKEKLLMATQDVFYFDYGCVVFWGLTPMEERAALIELKGFTTTSVSPDELDNSFDKLEFVFDRKANPQRPIRFDRMRLRSLEVEEKLALSYAMAQSSKLFVFESKIFQSLEMTRYLPQELASKGRISSSKRELNKIIGQLFVEQTEVNLFSSILDTPDFLWDDDEHVPAYQYLRSYLEVDDRVALLNNRLSVIRELLDVLTAQVADNNSARLEWIVIWLISIEIIMGIASNPLFAGRRLLTALAVPTAIIAFKRINWTAKGPRLDD